MKTYLPNYILIFLFLAAVSPAVKAADGDAGYAGSFLQIPIGARPSGMGGAYLAISDDGSGPLFNPAGTANLKSKIFTTSYRVLGLDRTLAYASFVVPAKANSVIGISWLYAGSGSVEARNSVGQLLGHEVSLNTHDFGVLFAKRFEDAVAAGLKMNYFHADFPEINAGAVGIDFGVMLYLDHFFDREKRDLMPVKNIQVGATVKNIGSRFIWNNENYMLRYRGISVPASEQEDDIPVEFGLGTAARFLDQRLTLAADFLKDTKTDPKVHAGAEYLYQRKMAVRSGISDGSFTAGAGYVFKFGKQTLAIDYAFSTDKVGEGEEHIFSFDLVF
jgi:hypothetical protein